MAEGASGDQAQMLKALAAAAPSSQIIDMTGKERRVISELGQSSAAALADARTQFPELRHNIKLITDLNRAPWVDTKETCC